MLSWWALPGQVRKILEEIRQMAVTQAQLAEKIEEAFTALAEEIEQIKAAIDEKLPADVDLTPEYNRLEELIETVKGIIPDDVAPDPEPEPEPEVPVDPEFPG